MMQELLLALLGYDGPIFQRRNDKFKVSDGIFSEQEEQMVEKVLQLAAHYSQLVTFCRNNSTGQGHYRAALAAGITDALKPYRHAVVSLEGEVLRNPQYTLTHLHTTMHPYTPTLTTLRGLLEEVCSRDVRGCRVLESIHTHTEQAVLDTRDLMNRLDQRVHSVLYEQLSQWLLYGALVDPHREFFLQTSDKKSSSTTDCVTGGDDDYDTDGVDPAVDRHTGGDSDDGDGSRVCLVPQMLPRHLPTALAHKALFVGEAVRDFEGRRGKVGDEDHSGNSSASHPGVPLLQRSEATFMQRLTALGGHPSFSLARLTVAVEDVRAAVSQHLCEAVVSAGLVSALCHLKDVLLLGRGELFHALLTATSRHALDGQVNMALNVSLAFQSCGQQVHVEECLLERFSMTCSEETLSSLPQVVRDTEGHAGTGWSSLRLEYKPASPVLRRVLCRPCLQRRYRRLFAFLLCVRRVQHRLHACWVTHTASNRRGRQQWQDRAAWTLRHHMTLLLDGLQYYLQVDVLESHHHRLLSSITSCTDYQQLQCLVGGHLASLSRHCFMSHALVSRCFSAVFSLCLRLCHALLDTTVSEEEPPSCPEGGVPSMFPMEELQRDWSIACSRLFLVLCSLEQLPGEQQQYTASLLARIDYTGHYRHNHYTLRGLGEGEEQIEEE